MLVGFIFGASQLDSAEPYLQSEVNYTFIEFGMILTLFFAGLSVNCSNIWRYFWYNPFMLKYLEILSALQLSIYAGHC